MQPKTQVLQKYKNRKITQKNNYRMHIKHIINGRMNNHIIKATKIALYTHCR